jgi:glycosyltransferase involved in cell wall biosynthesis
MLLEGYYPGVGGMETAALNLSACLTKAGIPVFFITRRSSPDLAATDTVEGLRVYRVSPTMRNPRARWLLVFTCIPALIRHRNEYDIILVPGFRALGISAVMMGKLLGKKSVLKAESRGEMSGEFFAGGLQDLKLKRSSLLFRLFMALRNRVLFAADALVSLSSEMTEEFTKAGAPAVRTHVIPQPADVERFQPAAPEAKKQLREKLGLPQNDLIVSFTGRIVSYKGLPVLVRAWETICQSRKNVRLLIVGAGGVDIFNCEAELKEYVKAHQMEDRVLFPGAVRNVDEYLKASDIYAFPTENEAFPLALLEAMACGLPVVSTFVGGIRDVLSPGENGLMIDAGSQDQLQAALERLLDDSGLRESLGRAGLKTVHERYTRDMVTKQYLDLFSRLEG